MKLDIFVKNSSLGLIFGIMLHESVRMKSNVLIRSKKKNKGLITRYPEVCEGGGRCLEPLDVSCIRVFIDLGAKDSLTS